MEIFKKWKTPLCLFKHSRAVAHLGRSGGSGLPGMKPIRGCIVYREFKDSNILSKSLPFIITIYRQFSEISVKKNTPTS